jgi:hypothetical protein
MTEAEKIAATAEANARQRSLELLFDYTKFHIGVYLTLTASYLTAATAKLNDKPVLTLRPTFFWIAVIAFLVAGLAGGVIASSITQTNARSSADFLEEETGLWVWRASFCPARDWARLEHTSFWLGLIAAVLSFR